MTKVVNNFITRPLCHAIPWRTYRNPNICHHPRECMLYTRSFIHGIHRKETGKGNQVSSMSVIVGWKDISNIQSNTYAPPPLPAHLNIGVPPTGVLSATLFLIHCLCLCSALGILSSISSISILLPQYWILFHSKPPFGSSSSPLFQ